MTVAQYTSVALLIAFYIAGNALDRPWRYAWYRRRYYRKLRKRYQKR